MGDPLSVAASVAGLVSLGLQTTQYLHDFYTAYRDQDKDLARTADRLDDLSTSLRLIEEIVTTRKWPSDQKATITTVEHSVSRCKDVIAELQEQARKFREQQADSLPKLIKGAGRRVAYPFRRSTLQKLEEDVDELRSNLSVTLQALQLQDIHKTQDDVGEIIDLIKLGQAQNLAEKVRNWLRAPDATIDYNVASTKCHPGTGKWFVEDPRFIKWIHDDNSFLWIRGLAGCGKSVLCSTAIQHAFRHRCSQIGGAIAFFFFTFSDSSKQDASALVRALLLQLAGQIEGLDVELSQLQKLHLHGTPPVLVLLDCLRQAVIKVSDVHVLIDALDESPVENARAEVLSAIQTMRGWKVSNLHLLVTSRHVIDIEQGLDATSQETVAIKTEDVDSDILSYVSHQVDHDRQLQRWGAHRENIKEYLVRHSNGMFRWVECQLGPLRKCPQSLKHLQRCLESLPRSLDATYDRMLQDLDEESKEEAQRILTLLCFSTRPMTVAEVIDAITVDLDTASYDIDRKLQSTEDLRRICPGLIEIDIRQFERYTYEHYPNTLNQDIEFVRIAHFSVQEYLLSDRIKQTPASGFALSEIEGHSQISKTCLIYLHNEDYLHRSLQPSLVNEYPFGRFAAKYWHHYYKSDDCPADEESRRLATTLFTSAQAFTRWVRLFDPDSPSGPIYYDWAHNEWKPPAYYVALLGLGSIVFSILLDQSLEADDQGRLYEFALRAALSRHDSEFVQTLLDACMLRKETFGATLEMAAKEDNIELLQLMLDSRANDEALRVHLNKALIFACQSGHEEVVQVLISNGADLNASSSKVLSFDMSGCYGEMLDDDSHNQLAHTVQRHDVNETALLAALIHEHEDIAQLLIDSGVDTNITNKHFLQALCYASQFGFVEIVRALLKSLSATGARNETKSINVALYTASYNGQKEVVRILLDHSSNADVQQILHGPAIYIAVLKGHMELALLLIDGDADISLWEKQGGILLGYAASLGDTKSVTILLDKGIDVNTIPENSSETALERAITSFCGRPETVQVLLERGASPNILATNNGYSPLCIAAGCGSVDIVRVLVDGGAIINARANYDRSDMRKAIFGRNPLTATSMALPQTLDALTTASMRCHTEVVDLLLGYGAKLDDLDYRIVAESYRLRPYDDIIHTARALDDAHPARPLDLVPATKLTHEKVYSSRTRPESKSWISVKPLVLARLSEDTSEVIDRMESMALNPIETVRGSTQTTLDSE